MLLLWWPTSSIRTRWKNTLAPKLTLSSKRILRNLLLGSLMWFWRNFLRTKRYLSASMMIQECFIPGHPRYMAFLKSINLATLSGPLYHSIARLYQHSTNSSLIFLNLSRSLIIDLRTLKISSISLDRTWTLPMVIIVPWMSNLYTPRVICIPQWTSSWKKLEATLRYFPPT